MASAWPTSPGLQASMPTASSVPGRPRARTVRRNAGSRWALRATLTRGRRPAPRSADRTSRNASRQRSRSKTKRGVLPRLASSAASRPARRRRPSTHSRPGRVHQGPCFCGGCGLGVMGSSSSFVAAKCDRPSKAAQAGLRPPGRRTAPPTCRIGRRLPVGTPGIVARADPCRRRPRSHGRSARIDQAARRA